MRKGVRCGLRNSGRTGLEGFIRPRDDFAETGGHGVPVKHVHHERQIRFGKGVLVVFRSRNHGVEESIRKAEIFTTKARSARR